MSELTPITRVESYLDAIVNSGTPPLEDITRIETFLQAIYDNQVCALTPITRIEMFLGKISGQSLTLPEPVTRVELYLAAIAGEDVELPEMPITRLEMYLADWADSGDWTTISGAIVEFITQRAHKIKSCVVSLSPQQDLHGYDYPWPAGGGKNKLDAASTFTNPIASLVIKTLTLKPNTQYTASTNHPIGSGTTAATLIADMNETLSSGTCGFWNGTSRTKTTDENGQLRIAYRLVDSETAETFLAYNYQLEEGSSATSFAPFSNICPISGWTGCEVFVDGKNLLDQSKCLPKQYITASGTVGSSDDWSASDYTPIKGGQTYTFSGYTSTGWSACHAFYDSDKNFISSEFAINHSTFTAPNNAAYVRLSIKSETPTLAQLEIGSTATDYEPYKGNSYSVTFGETVYGGTVNFVSGVLTLDRVCKTLTTARNLSGAYQGSIIYNSSSPETSDADFTKPFSCNRLKYVGNSSTSAEWKYGTCINANSGSFNLWIKDGAFSDLAEATAWLGSNETQICYNLATPITIQLTPQQVTALKGYNAMWSNAGDIEVTVHGTPVEISTQQALNMLLGGAYRNDQTQDDVSDDEALDIILGGDNK